MKTLVTGCAGFIGSHLTERLLREGYEVFGTYRRLSTPNFWRLQYLDIFEKMNPIPADLVDAGSMVEAVKIGEPDEIYHLAAQSFVGASFEQPIGAAESHGAEYKGRKAGGIGHVGFPKERRIYLHSEAGYNYRMTNIQATIGLAQFEKIDGLAEMRRRNAHLYNEYLKDVEGIRLPMEKEWAKNVYWMYSILIEDEFGMSRDELMEELEKKGVETRRLFIPMHVQPVFQNMGLFNGERYPVAEDLARKGVYLPSSSGLGEGEIKFICDTIKDVGKRG